jgi:uroporphyrinogen-III synthase
LTSLRIWVTRTQPGANATAARLTAMGHAPVVQPVLKARPIPGAVLDLAGIDALAFTSGHAITAFAALSTERDLPVFTVGEASALLARLEGFSKVASADGDVRALAELIADLQPGRVLNATAVEAAADLPALLAKRGVAATAVPIYDSVPTETVPPLGDIDAVLIHSLKAARLIAGVLGHRHEAALMDVYAISAAVAEPLRAVKPRALKIAKTPDELALMALLRR